MKLSDKVHYFYNDIYEFIECLRGNNIIKDKAGRLILNKLSQTFSKNMEDRRNYEKIDFSKKIMRYKMENKIKTENEKLIEQISKNLDLSELKNLLDNAETNTITDSTENINYSFQNEIVNETAVNIDKIMIDVFKDVLKFITANKIKSVIELKYKFELKSIKDNVMIDMSLND